MIENNIKNRKLTDFTELKYEYFHSLYITMPNTITAIASKIINTAPP